MFTWRKSDFTAATLVRPSRSAATRNRDVLREAGASETGRAGRALSRKGGRHASAAEDRRGPRRPCTVPERKPADPLDAEQQAVMQGLKAEVLNLLQLFQTKLTGQ